VSTNLAFCDLLLGEDELSQRAVKNARFSEPHGARGLYLIGHLLLQTGKIDECRACWNQSLAASESFRPAILLETATSLGSEIALEWFRPDSYESCVKAAIGVRSEKNLSLKLFEQADQFWTSSRPRLTESLAVTRASHLEATAACEAVVAWLTECLLAMPDNLRLRRQTAVQLEKCGKNSEAYDEWLRIQAFDPSDKDAENALKRLIRLPPTTERK
jgi:tetratricopeptide (TPR) repeat protein